MEQNDGVKTANAKTHQVSTIALRVKRETAKKIAVEVLKANKKSLGRRVRPDDLIKLALTLIEPRHIEDLQRMTLSNADRLEQRYRDYVKANGQSTKEEFLGRLLDGQPLSVGESRTLTRRP